MTQWKGLVAKLKKYLDNMEKGRTVLFIFLKELILRAIVLPENPQAIAAIT